MKLFKSKEKNLVHYVTGVTYRRVPLFRTDESCSLFVESLLETRIKDPFKLVGYVLMPDHFHLLVNPIELNISKVIGRLKGRAASKILKNLRDGGEVSMLNSLKLGRPLASGQTHAVWLQDFSSIDLWQQIHSAKAKLHSYESSPCRIM